MSSEAVRASTRALFSASRSAASPVSAISNGTTDSAIPAVGYPVPYAVTAVLVLVAGYLALFL